MVEVLIRQCWLLNSNPMEEVFLFNMLKALKSLPLEINSEQWQTKTLWNASFVQTAANVKLNVQTELSAGTHLCVGLGYNINTY